MFVLRSFAKYSCFPMSISIQMWIQLYSDLLHVYLCHDVETDTKVDVVVFIYIYIYIYLYIDLCIYILISLWYLHTKVDVVVFRSSAGILVCRLLVLLQGVVVCCSLLQGVVVCCSLLQGVVVCCSLLQGVPVCCGVLQLEVALNPHTDAHTHVYLNTHSATNCLCPMGWLWSVGSIKLQVSFAKEPYTRDDILKISISRQIDMGWLRSAGSIK